MDYLDYLPDHAYDDLPPTVRERVPREVYDRHRDLVLTLGADMPPPGLPAPLADAYRARKTTTGSAPSPVGRRWPLLAAAGWAFFLITAAALWLRPPAQQVVYRSLSAPLLPPRVVQQTRTDTLWRTRWRTRVVRDTVLRSGPSLRPHPVYRTDTLYVLVPPADSLSELRGSRSLARQPDLLQFLYGAE